MMVYTVYTGGHVF